MTARVRWLLTVISGLALLMLGLLARTRANTDRELQIDRAVASVRFPTGTDVALSLTAAAGEVVGIAVLIGAVAVLLLRRRRCDAARLVGAVGGSWLLGLGVKVVIDRPRPPASLELLVPDPSGSFPSGHDTTACAMVLVALLVLRGLGRARIVVVLVAALFALAVGGSRIYLGDHYPTDVVGSWLTVCTAALAVWAFTDLQFVRRLGASLLHDPAPLLPAS